MFLISEVPLYLTQVREDPSRISTTLGAFRSRDPQGLRRMNRVGATRADKLL